MICPCRHLVRWPAELPTDLLNGCGSVRPSAEACGRHDYRSPRGGPDMLDGRCRFGPRAKREMVARVLAGEHARAVARSLGCSPTTVTTARDRWLAASEG